MAKKLSFYTRFLPFSPSVALLCNSKKPSTEHRAERKNNPVGYFSERASWRRVKFSL
ncbi:MAG: hypothetical protein TRG1_251 [Flavobacteriaceae bacterium FS1-H7996/R]|nr:MAG: hypothetical protein TRG1_251 [Flavobacteriaceae bacterium FS1-H7996/R]